MLRTMIVGAAAIAALLPGQGAAQSAAGLTVYSQGHLKGARTAIGGPSQYRRPLVVRSLVAPPGTDWELCSGLTYTGCRQVSGTVSAMVMTVRSARPVAAVLPTSAIARAGGAPTGQSLRGVASEYFVAPDEGGSRVEVQPGTAEAMTRRASEFCRTRGWRSSAHGRMQKAGGRMYLADVLCVDG
jgi:hypothetical protein